jgi:cytochrome c-type biogenesis protein CcmF
MALAMWLLAATLGEWLGRIRLFRVPLGDSFRRAASLPRAAYGMTLAHIGFAIAIAGITGAAAWKEEVVQMLRPGESLSVGGYDYRLEGVERLPGPNYMSDTARFTVTREGETIALLTPEKRTYMVGDRPTTEAAIHTTGMADLYAVIGDPDGTGGWTVRLYHEPLVPWIWAGALAMLLGGAVSLTDRRLRVGAPRRSGRAATAAAGA